MRPLFQRLLIAVAILLVYMPSITAGLCHVDDAVLADQLLNRTHWDLRHIFFPGDANGLYYRPLIVLSYVMDRFVWFADERFMHLENIAIHLANALLVYTLARLVAGEGGSEARLYVPLIAALAFGLHPVNTESASWICGRSDLLAGTCVLGSATPRGSIW